MRKISDNKKIQAIIKDKMYSGSSLVDLKAELSRKEEEFGKLRTNQDKSKSEVRNKTFQKVYIHLFFYSILCFLEEEIQ